MLSLYIIGITMGIGLLACLGSLYAGRRDARKRMRGAEAGLKLASENRYRERVLAGCQSVEQQNNVLRWWPRNVGRWVNWCGVSYWNLGVPAPQPKDEKTLLLKVPYDIALKYAQMILRGRMEKYEHKEVYDG